MRVRDAGTGTATVRPAAALGPLAGDGTVWVRATDGDAASRVLVVYLLDFTYFYLYLVRCVQVVTR